MNELKPPVVLAFDVFGTVVDWYGSIRQEIEQALPDVNADEFTLAWRDGYAPALRAANTSNQWISLDVLHRQILDSLLDEFARSDVSESTRQSLTRGWHRLAPWPDTIAGMKRLKERFTLCSLSNGNIGLLTNMAKNAGIPWDCVLSAEVFKRYKPDPQVYQGVAEIFNLQPEQVMLVAAHQDDLNAAAACGLQTAFIERIDEYGPVRGNDVSGSKSNNWHATDFNHFAKLLGC